MQSSSIEDQVTHKHCLSVFLDYFFVGQTVRQTDKICRTFLKFGNLNRPAVFAKTAIRSPAFGSGELKRIIPFYFLIAWLLVKIVYMPKWLSTEEVMGHICYEPNSPVASHISTC